MKKIVEGDPHAKQLQEHLEAIKGLAQEAAVVRNAFLEKQKGLVEGFFAFKQNKHFCENILSFPERKAIAEETIIRSAETFHPRKGEFSTYVYWMIRRRIGAAAKKELVFRAFHKHSLDTPMRKKDGQDGATFGDNISCDNTISPLDGSATYERNASVREALALLELRPRLTLELLYGIVDGKSHTCAEVATIFRERDIRSESKSVPMTAWHVKQYKARGVRELKKILSRQKKVPLETDESTFSE